MEHHNYHLDIEAELDPTETSHAIRAAVQSRQYPLLVRFISIEAEDIPVISEWSDYIDVTTIEELGYIDYDTLEHYPRAVAALYRGLKSWYNQYPSRYISEMLDDCYDLYDRYYPTAKR